MTHKNHSKGKTFRCSKHYLKCSNNLTISITDQPQVEVGGEKLALVWGQKAKEGEIHVKELPDGLYPVALAGRGAGEPIYLAMIDGKVAKDGEVLPNAITSRLRSAGIDQWSTLVAMAEKSIEVSPDGKIYVNGKPIATKASFELYIEKVQRIKKLASGVKIVVGGPPHSGKSVFIEALTSGNLDKHMTMLFSACPDGEGPWLQKFYNDPEVVALRKKGEFTDEFVQRSKRVIKSWSGPLMIIDIGGIISEENAAIIEGATHAIILAGDLDKVSEWDSFFSKHKVSVVASLHSDYEGTKDHINGLDKKGRLQASVHHLERGEAADGREAIVETASVIMGLVEGNMVYQACNANDESRVVLSVAEFTDGLPHHLVEKTLTNGVEVTNSELLPSSIPEIYERAQRFDVDAPIWLDGPVNGWQAIALASSFTEAGAPEVSMRGPDGYVPVKALPQSEQGDTVVWEVSSEGTFDGKPVIKIHADVSASIRLLSPEDMDTMHIPQIPEGSIVKISTAGPHWFRASVARGYMANSHAVAALVPGKGSFVAWAEDAELLGKNIDS